MEQKQYTSSLMNHAQRELTIAALFDKDSDYEGMLGENVMELMQAFSNQGHSGNSAATVIELFTQLAQFKNLTPITNDPTEWMDVSAESGGNPMWQSVRNPALFSTDGGKNYYSVDDPKRQIVVSKEMVK